MLIIFLVLVFMSTVSARPRLIPAEQSKLDAWIALNMRTYQAEMRRITLELVGWGGLDQRLMEAELDVKVIQVRKDHGTGDFRTVTEAVNSVPSGNVRRVSVWIGGKVYREKITVDRTKPLLTFYGDENDMRVITYNGTALQYGTVYSATVAVESDYFVAVNIAFVNSAPMPDGIRKGAQAVAMRILGDKASFHNCKFIGF
ncbi:Putative pectinesterase 63 [Morus notabilis]|uniref:pectinesterase n=1 Tax=Morus notabilis TaxID=981085 RepID=W9S9A3_9ROSA|nr:Putative pectinesterase 63 [Morus notabilis]